MADKDFLNKVNAGDTVPSLVKKATLPSEFRLGTIFGIQLEADKGKAAEKAKELSVDSIHTTMVFGGVYLLQFISQMLTNWLPDSRGWLQGGRLDVKFIAPVTPGEVITSRGVVKSKTASGGRTTVVLDVWQEKENGQKVTAGEATIES